MFDFDPVACINLSAIFWCIYGFRGLGFRVCGLGFRVYDCGVLELGSLGFRGLARWGFGIWSCLEFRFYD